MLTIVQIADELQLSPSTARDYVHRFKQFFPTTKVAGSRHPKHSEQARDVLRDIKDGYANGLPTDEIEAKLSSKYPTYIDAESGDLQRTQNDNELRTTASTSSSFDMLVSMQAQHYQFIQQLLEDNRRITQRQDELMQKVVELLEEVRSTKPQIKASTAPEVELEGKTGKQASKGITEPHKGNKKNTKNTKSKEKKKGLFGKLFR